MDVEELNMTAGVVWDEESLILNFYPVRDFRIIYYVMFILLISLSFLGT